jgi:hypothetical protein
MCIIIIIIIRVRQMHNIFVNNYVFLVALVHVSKVTHHPQGVCYHVRVGVV